MIMYQEDPREVGGGMMLEEAFDVLGEVLESTAATRHYAGGRNNLRMALDDFGRHDDEISGSKRDQLTMAKLASRMSPEECSKILGRSFKKIGVTDNETKATALGTIGLGKAMVGRANALKIREKNKSVNASADMLREACLTILAALDEE